MSAPQAPEVAPEQVRDMFDQIARFYDLLNSLLSGGRDAAWRRRAASETGLRPGDAALDVCTGTGKLARLLRRRVGPQGRVTGVDFSTAMLSIARRHPEGVDFREGDATRLDGVADQSVDAVTVAFGLRNVVDREAAVRAALRVLRPGGRYVILEFAHVDVPLFGRVYAWYLTRVLPAIGRMLNPRSGAYTYLSRSIAAYPPAAAVSEWLRAAGFSDVRVVRMTLGIVTLHVATRPAAPR
jgi:demethylmenaquinone methyltransferase / 2-methoxy-6-polyprenyl-1,4-benzoquinol methylase